MNLPKEMRIMVFGDGKPLHGMFVHVKIEMKRKNHFNFGFGPTNIEGIVTVSCGDLLREAEKYISLAMMDYGHIESEATGTIFVMTLNRNALRRACDAYELFHDVSPYPPNYATNLKTAIEILERTHPSRLSVLVSAQPCSQCVVKCVSVQP